MKRLLFLLAALWCWSSWATLIATSSQDVTTYFVLRDSTNHAPKADITVTDLDLYYVEDGAAISSKADASALGAANSAHADNSAFNVGQGIYRIDWPDAAFDGGAGKRVILIVVCTGVDTTFLEQELSPPVGTAAAVSGSVGSVTGSVGSVTGSVGSVTSGVTLAADAVSAAAVKTDAVTEIQAGLSTLDGPGVRTAVGLASANLDTQLADLPTVTEFNARTLVASGYFDPAADGVFLSDASSDLVIADAVWNALTSGYGTAGTYGEFVKAITGGATAPTVEQIDTQLSSTHGAGAWGGGSGDGAIHKGVYVYDERTLVPIADVLVEVFTDDGYVNRVASGRTNNFGWVYFDLDEGVYYIRRTKGGVNFVNPKQMAVAP